MSQWAGVKIGLNVPYSFGTGNNISAEDLLARVVEVGFGALELRAQPVEHFLGSPTVRAAAEAAKAPNAAGARPAPPTAEQKADIRTWRLSAPSGKLKDFRQLYEKAGVAIDILKVDDLYTVSDEELDYFFQMARDLGARAVSAELPETRSDTGASACSPTSTRSSWPTTITPRPRRPIYEEAFTEARYNAANVDIGHWTATQNDHRSPSSPSTTIAFPTST